MIAALSGGSSKEARGPKPTTTTTQPVTKTGHELLDRLAKGRAKPLHLRFESDPAQVTDGRKLTMELWRDGDLVRQDIKLEAPGVVTELLAFQLKKGTFLCQRASEAGWTCEATRSTATETDSPAGLVEAAAANLSGADVVTTDVTIAGLAARCYAIDGDTGASTLCVTADGIPLRLGVQGQELTASVVEHEVDATVFTLPAEVSATPTSPTTATTVAPS